MLRSCESLVRVKFNVFDVSVPRCLELGSRHFLVGLRNSVVPAGYVNNGVSYIQQGQTQIQNCRFLPYGGLLAIIMLFLLYSGVP